MGTLGWVALHFDTQLIASHLKKEEITRRHAAFYDQHAFLKTSLCWKKRSLKNGSSSRKCVIFLSVFSRGRKLHYYASNHYSRYTYLGGGPGSSMFICKKNCHYFPLLNPNWILMKQCMKIMSLLHREVLLICMHISFRLENPLGPAGAINQVGLAPLTLRQKRVKS